MKPTTVAFVAGLTGSIFASVLITRRIKSRLDSKFIPNSTQIEVMNLRVDLIKWLVLAPGNGYSAEQIASRYNEQVAFIELISKV